MTVSNRGGVGISQRIAEGESINNGLADLIANVTPSKGQKVGMSLNEANLASLHSINRVGKQNLGLNQMGSNRGSEQSGDVSHSDRGLGDSPVNFEEDDNNEDGLDFDNMESISQRMNKLNQSHSSFRSNNNNNGNAANVDFYMHKMRGFDEEMNRSGRPLHTEDNEA